jgi:hypothetical protein
MANSSHMWPKYPKEARRTPRFAKTRPACLGSKAARGKGKGPSRAAASASTPASSVSTEVVVTTVCHRSPPRPFTRCGRAEATAIAPASVPRATPRPRRNQVTMSLKAGG